MKRITKETYIDDLKPGDKVCCLVGQVTVRGIGIGVPDSDRATMYWVEDQPPVTRHRSNSVTVIVE